LVAEEDEMAEEPLELETQEEALEDSSAPEERPQPASEQVASRVQKRLLRSRKDRVFAGVCGGIGHYFGVDPVLARVLWVIGTIITGVVPGIVLYFAAMVIVPENTKEEAGTPRRSLPFDSNILWGGLLIAAGLYFFLKLVLPWDILDFWGRTWSTIRGIILAVALIGVGGLLIFGFSRKSKSTGRQLTRSKHDRIIGGVCGGLAAYFEVDPMWVRVGCVVLALISFGVGAVVYLVAMFTLPEE
jgi:phage shock protein C